jgi:RNA-directed DNA polymerase
MNGGRKSDSPIVPEKGANKGNAQAVPAERLEGRGLAKGNPGEQTRFWTQSQTDLQQALDRIRTVAKEDRKARFTALWHHVYHVNGLREAYKALKPEASPGVDGETWTDYGKDLENRLKALSERLKRGNYRARPVKRVNLPKPDGGMRPIGITALEDKIVQRATVRVLNAIYETDFMGFSYGYRPGRNPHHALDAATVAIENRKVNWVLDADIRGFFDTMDHEWVMRFLAHRIADRRVQRHVKKWLNAGVLEEGTWRKSEEGVPQGGNISPLLANLYLHHALDQWAEQWRRRHARGQVVIVRYADDFIVGFQDKDDAERFTAELRERLKRFNLALHEEKTRLIEFGRFAREDRKRRGQGKPETFDFLGFTHYCGQTRNGKFTVGRKTMAKKVRGKLKALRETMRKRIHYSIAENGQWLASVLAGHYRYYGVPRNYARLRAFHRAIEKLWYWALRRRSDKKQRITWERTRKLTRRWLPPPRIYHPYPNQRLNVTTQGRSPVR